MATEPRVAVQPGDLRRIGIDPLERSDVADDPRDLDLAEPACSGSPPRHLGTAPPVGDDVRQVPIVADGEEVLVRQRRRPDLGDLASTEVGTVTGDTEQRVQLAAIEGGVRTLRWRGPVARGNVLRAQREHVRAQGLRIGRPRADTGHHGPRAHRPRIHEVRLQPLERRALDSLGQVGEVVAVNPLVPDVRELRPQGTAPATIDVTPQASRLGDQRLAASQQPGPLHSGREVGALDLGRRSRCTEELRLVAKERVLRMAAPATGEDELAFQHRVLPVRHVPMRLGECHRAALPLMADRAAEFLRRMTREQVPRMGTQRLFLFGLRRIVDADVTALAPVDSPEIGNERLLDPDLEACCELGVQPRSVLRLPAAILASEVLAIGLEPKEGEHTDAPEDRQDLEAATRCQCCVVVVHLSASANPRATSRNPSSGPA